MARLPFQTLIMDLATLLRGFADADRHAGGIRCLRLFLLDAAVFDGLVADVERLIIEHQPSDAAHPAHVTSWTQPVGTVKQFSLLNASGRFDDFSIDHNLSCRGKRFAAGAEYPTIASLIDALPHTVNFRVSVLGPSSELPPHEEHLLVRTHDGGVGARARFHLPLTTTPLADLTLDGQVFHLEARTAYFVNHGCVHAARNRHPDASRVHLTWDMLLTRDVFETMFGRRRLNFPATRIPDEERYPLAIATAPRTPYRRVAPSVARDEARRLTLCAPQ